MSGCSVGFVEAGDLTAVSYRPVRVEDSDSIELRIQTLALGSPLPSLPLGLNAGLTVAVDFEACYQEARERSRL